MKTLTTLLAGLFFSCLTFSQSPEIIWQKTIGGNSLDNLINIESTIDGGYILAGYSRSSISGNKTVDTIGKMDFWVVKLDSASNIEWQKTIGGSGDDYLESAIVTTDGGYLLGGFSNSPISGDKTQDTVGGMDYWIVKLDELGNVEWDKTYGGSDEDYLFDFLQLPGGGYLLAGTSASNISGDKSEDSKGNSDYWILKISPTGNIKWQKTIGGDSFDDLRAISINTDNEIILAGSSFSGISGDKTEPSQGSYDYWIIKLNAIGSILWQNTIGGNEHDAPTCTSATVDGGAIVGGFSYSGNSGDKSEGNIGSTDYWIIKLDGLGNIEWENTIGGSETDFVVAVHSLPDESYILGGYSGSDISADKSENSKGSTDYWIININNVGEVVWQKTIGGTETDFLNDLQLTPDNGYILAGCSYSNSSFDKSENSFGDGDFWAIKLNNLLIEESVPEYVPTENLIAWYPFNGNAIDESGNNHNGTITGGVTSTTDRFDNPNSAYIFDGTSGFISVPTLDTLQYSPITFSAWGIINSYFPSPEPGHKFRSIIGRNTTFIEENGVIGFYADGNVAGGTYDNNFLMWRGGGVTGDMPYSNSTPELNTWVHVVYTQSETGEFKWYTNGVLTNEGTFTDDQNDFNFFQIGGCNNTGVLSVLWNDKLDDIGVWNRVLSPTEVNHLYGGCTTAYYADADEDNFGNAFSEPVFSCDPIEGFVTNNLDCNDTNASINPGEIEICDGIDNNCDGNIDEGAEPTISISAGGPTAFCKGESVILTATHSGGALQWKKNGVNIPGATGTTYTVTTKATYTCVITSPCGVVTSNSILVNVYKLPFAIISAGGPTTFCPGSSVTLSVGVASGQSYQWFKGANPITGATGITYVATTSGNYKCRVTKNSTGCSKMSGAIAVSASCRLAGDNDITLNIFPNPTDGRVNIQLSEELLSEASLKVYSIMGRLLINEDFGPYMQTTSLDMSHFSAGIYLIEIKSGNNILTDKIIKE